MKHPKTAALIIGAFAVTLVLSLGGCAINGGGKEYRDPSVPIVVEKGEEFSIVLESNPTTGYRWMLQKELDEKIITLQKMEFEEPESDLLGAPGEERWTFQAEGLGRTTIELKYARPWEEADSSKAAGGERAADVGGEDDARAGETSFQSGGTEESAVEAEGRAATETEAVTGDTASGTETVVFNVWVKKKGAADKEPEKYDDPEEAIEVEEGLRFSIVLESNPTTGYQWRLAEPLDEEILGLVSAVFEKKGGGHAEGEEVVGAPGEEVWTFEALGKGEAEIHLEYVRPWEEKAPEESKTFKVEVTSAGEEASEH